MKALKSYLSYNNDKLHSRDSNVHISTTIVGSARSLVSPQLPSVSQLMRRALRSWHVTDTRHISVRGSNPTLSTLKFAYHHQLHVWLISYTTHSYQQSSVRIFLLLFFFLRSLSLTFRSLFYVYQVGVWYICLIDDESMWWKFRVIWSILEDLRGICCQREIVCVCDNALSCFISR